MPFSEDEAAHLRSTAALDQGWSTLRNYLLGVGPTQARKILERLARVAEDEDAQKNVLPETGMSLAQIAATAHIAIHDVVCRIIEEHRAEED
jgi:hypothetical protein